MGRRREEGGNPTAEKGKTYPAGERDKDYQQLPFSRAHSRTCQAARAKYRGREEPGPGRGLPALPATLTQPKQATPSTTSSVKNSEAARPQRLLPGNLDCVATETTTSRERPGLARRATGTKSPTASRRPGPGGQKMHAVPGQDTDAREQGGRKGAGGRREGRETERGAGLDQLPSPFPSPSPEVGCPTLPKVLCWVTAGRG